MPGKEVIGLREKPDEVFTVYLKNGSPVEVSWYKSYFSATDHLELRGCMTETGYRSEFLNKEDDDDLDPDAVKEHARQLAQKCWEENPAKHGAQVSLL